MIVVLPVMTAGVIVYLYRTGRLSRILFFCLLAGSLAAAVSLLSDLTAGTRQQITELPKNGGLLQGSVPLTVETDDGVSEQVEIRVPEAKLSPEELQGILEEKAAELEEGILGKNDSLQKVEWDLELPESFADSPVAVVWSSDRPEILSWEGKIGTAAVPGGSAVTLRASLSLEEETLETAYDVRVYPSKETAAIGQRLQEKGDALNEEQPGETYRRPEEIDGKQLTWYRENGGTGQNLCLLLLAAAALAAVSAGKRKEEDRKKRQKELLRRYPELLSKTHLLLAAGLSLRKVFERLAADYRREKKEIRETAGFGRRNPADLV